MTRVPCACPSVAGESVAKALPQQAFVPGVLDTLVSRAPRTVAAISSRQSPSRRPQLEVAAQGSASRRRPVTAAAADTTATTAAGSTTAGSAGIGDVCRRADR